MLQSLKKLLRVDPHIKTWINLGENWAKMAHLPKIQNFGKFHLNSFYLIISPYHSVKFKKNPRHKS